MALIHYVNNKLIFLFIIYYFQDSSFVSFTNIVMTVTVTVERPLVTFSILSEVYQEQERRERQQPQQQQQQQQDSKKKKITIKPKAIHDAPAPAPEKENEKQKKKITITIVKKRFKNSDIAPPATMCFIPKNELYRTPPPNCCRFFIENKHCFLRQRDNACICPTSTTVIGFWNEKVGNECKLLPVEDETTYEEAAIATANNIFPEEVPEEAQLQPTSSPNPKPNAKSSTQLPVTPKPKYVSDAQRARIASEPVALLRAKLAKQYGMMAKKN